VSEALRELGEYIGNTVGEAVAGQDIIRDELILNVAPKYLVRVLTFLRDDANCLFQQLLTIAGVDFPEREKRFEVVYILLSLRHNQRIRVRVAAGESEAVPTATGVFASANWFEREVWDLYGVWFSDHPDLRRLLSDYGFEGHALRKDFPLTGYVELRYDDDQKRVVYEPVRLTQDFRSFDFLSPWEGMTNVMLAGDEKAEAPTGGKQPGSNK
jgi:NADH-quinone oxidoreductase subunit C